MASPTRLSFDEIIKRNLNSEQIRVFNKIHYGREDHCALRLKESTLEKSKNKFDIQGYYFAAAKEIRKSRIVKIGLIQHSIVLPTTEPIRKQRNAIFDKVETFIDTAVAEGVQIVCLQEAWSIPFFLCTKEKDEWQEFVESPTSGPSTQFLMKLAKKYQLTIVSPILEKDDNGVWWNSAVVIDHEGNYMGKHRKNHLPSVGSFSEISYYAPGNMGHSVFETKYAKIAVNICYGRHHALNWLMFGVNGAEIVFNPSATISEFGESFWGIEARNAAISNGYFTCSINRVGTEEFLTKNGQKIARSYYGSSYVTAPNGCRTPGLSRVKDGLLIVEVDLNMCRQARDQWGFSMTSRLEMYAKELDILKKS